MLQSWASRKTIGTVERGKIVSGSNLSFFTGGERMKFEAYQGKEPFLFASYSHVDADRVDRILRIMHAQGFRIWYDQRGEGIPLANNWKEIIDSRLDDSRAFLVFLSNGTEERQEVIRELEYAAKKRTEDPSYVILPVFLQRVPLRNFPEKARKLLGELQYIGLWNYGGVTSRFVDRLCFAPSWPREVIDEEQRRRQGLVPWNPDASVAEKIEDLVYSREYVFQDADPRLVCTESEEETVEFYQVDPGETAQGALYPLTMDNQWCPVKFYEDEEFLKEGFASERIREECRKLQREDVYRGLLHARQILVNRAFLQNSPVFLAWYAGDSETERDAFARLLETGAILLVLYREHGPCEKPRYANANWESWRELCLRHRTYCLRLDWENDETNQRETDKKIGFNFHNFCITTVEDRYRLRDMETVFGLSGERAQRFEACWKQVQRNAIAVRESTGKQGGYSREQFYKDFIVRPGSSVVECRIDPEKEFASIMKQVIDARYDLNMADALGLQVLAPRDMRMNPVLMDRLYMAGGIREVSAEELEYAVGSFDTEFLYIETVNAVAPRLTLTQVERMRRIPGWDEYLRGVETAGKRAREWDINLYDIVTVWERYQSWIKEVQKEFPELNWKKRPGAITLIYRFGSKEVTAVYRAGEKEPQVWENSGLAGQEKTVFTIDYICGDASDQETDNCLLTEIRLFEGKTRESGQRAYRAVRLMMDRSHR